MGYVGQRTIEREEAARIGVPLIDGVAQGWFEDRPDLKSKDRFHPNDAGQAYLGQRVAADLRKLHLA